MSAQPVRTTTWGRCNKLPRLRSLCCAGTLVLNLLPMAAGLARADTDFIASAETRALGLPFSDAVRIDNLLVMSGQLGVDPVTFKLVEGGIEAETRQIFSNMQRILAVSEVGLESIVKCTVMIADIAEWPSFNTLYVTYFPGNKPARSAFGANGLALGARVELECWAVLSDAEPE